MPSITDNANALQSMKDSGQLQPVTAATNNNPPPIAPAGPPSPNPLLRSPLPPSMSYQPDMLRQYFNNAIPQQRVPPLPALANVQANASAKSQASAVASAASTLQILVNGVKSANQARLNLIGSGITVDSNGNVTFNILTDGLTHGRSPWEGDPSVNTFTDDFFQSMAASSGSTTSTFIGQMGWTLVGTGPAHSGYGGGLPPYSGQFFWDNSSTAGKAASLILLQNGSFGGATGSNYGGALFDSVGWQYTVVFRLGGSIGGIASNQFPFGAKAMYIGLAGTNAVSLSGATEGEARPEVFFGVRYDTSGYYTGSPSNSATAVTQTGTSMALTGTFTGANQIAGTSWVGLWFSVAGSGDTNNNGVFKCTAATPTLLTLTNPNGVTITGQTITVIGSVPFVLTAAGNGNGTQVVYTGTITNGGTNAYVGQEFYVSGFGNAGNNGGPWKCTANSTTSITLANPIATGSGETHAGYAGGPIINDTQLVLEAVQNPTYSLNEPTNYTQGVTLATGIVPTTGAQVWHRLDIYGSTTGEITITLDGTYTLTTAVSKQTIATGSNGLAGNVGSAGSPADYLSLAWTIASGSVAASPWASGSQVTVTGFSGAQAGFNNTFTVLQNETEDGSGLYLSYPPATSPEVIAQTSVTGTMSGYPAIFPMLTFGNDNLTSGIVAGQASFWVDFVSYVWNPALGSGAAATITKPRYF